MYLRHFLEEEPHQFSENLKGNSKKYHLLIRTPQMDNLRYENIAKRDANLERKFVPSRMAFLAAFTFNCNTTEAN